MLDTLSDFNPENGFSEQGFEVRSAQPAQSLTIAELLSRSVSLEWYEAVAISQAVCEKLRLSGDASRSVHIAPDNVSIDASGDVHVAAVRKMGGATAISEVADLLRVLLADQNVPTPLRLALSQTAVTSSLEEWANTIAYYERPNRAALIQAVYQRATDEPSQATEIAPRVATPLPVVSTPPAPPQPETPVRRPAKPSNRHLAALSIATAVAVLAAAGVWVVQNRRPNSAVPKPADPTTETFQKRLNTAASVVETMVSRIPVIGGGETSVDPDPAPTLPTGKWIHLSPDSRPRFEPLIIVMPVTRSLPLSIPAAEEGLAVAHVPPSSVSASTIYSAADGDVVPPVAVYPQFPSTYPPGITPNDFAEFEVIVTTAGGVESVRARRVPVTMAEAVRVTMSLSAAKTWRFRPGLKDGEPVKYRQVIRVLKN